jgi:hypothetical protein
MASAYHRTTAENGAAILREGFRDSEGTWGTLTLHRGVWVTLERPWDLLITGPPPGDDPALLIVEVPETAVAESEWIEEGKGYRELLVPAEVLNRYPVHLAWECDECGAVAVEATPGWTSKLISTAWGERFRSSTCGDCANSEAANETTTPQERR